MNLGGPPREWADARLKVEAEGCCRKCDRVLPPDRLEFDHVIGRQYDDPMTCGTCKGSRRRLAGAGPCTVCKGSGLSRTLYVDPDSGIPLCNSCHRAKHRGEFDLLPLLTLAEQLYCVRKLEGLEKARVVLAPSAYREAA